MEESSAVGAGHSALQIAVPRERFGDEWNGGVVVLLRPLGPDSRGDDRDGSSQPLAPHPARGQVDILWTRPPAPGAEVRWNLVDVTGRRVNSGRFEASGMARERAPWSGRFAPAPGVYWLDLELGGQRERARLVVLP